MSNQPQPPAAPQLVCGKCKIALAPGKVTVTYLGATFPIELFKCPGCGLVHVPESLAIGKMAQVEQALEDK
jgi:hypothetical protein